MVPLDKELQWVNVKKAAQTDLDTFRHNQAYPGIIQAHSKLRAMVYPKPETYSEPLHIQNSGIIKTQGLFRHLRRQTSTMKCFAKIAENSFPI